MDFISGARLLLDKIRYLPLNDPAVWNSAVKGGIFARIGHVEISHDGLPAMAEREHSLQKWRK